MVIATVCHPSVERSQRAQGLPEPPRLAGGVQVFWALHPWTGKAAQAAICARAGTGPQSRRKLCREGNLLVWAHPLQRHHVINGGLAGHAASALIFVNV